MRIVELIDDREVIEKILRHLGLWEEGVRVHTGTDPPGEPTVEPWFDDPFPDYDIEPVVNYANGGVNATGSVRVVFTLSSRIIAKESPSGGSGRATNRRTGTTKPNLTRPVLLVMLQP